MFPTLQVRYEIPILHFCNLLVYYSTVKERATVERLFYEDDMCMIYNMKMGRLYNRWMGTITLSNNGNKCVVISTVSGEKLCFLF